MRAELLSLREFAQEPLRPQITASPLKSGSLASPGLSNDPPKLPANPLKLRTPWRGPHRPREKWNPLPFWRFFLLFYSLFVHFEAYLCAGLRHEIGKKGPKISRCPNAVSRTVLKRKPGNVLMFQGEATHPKNHPPK